MKMRDILEDVVDFNKFKESKLKKDRPEPPEPESLSIMNDKLKDSWSKIVAPAVDVDPIGLDHPPKVKPTPTGKFTKKHVCQAIKTHHPDLWKMILDNVEVWNNGAAHQNQTVPLAGLKTSKINTGEFAVLVHIPGTTTILKMRHSDTPDSEVRLYKRIMQSNMIHAFKDIFGWYAKEVKIGGGFGSIIYVILSDKWYQEQKSG